MAYEGDTPPPQPAPAPSPAPAAPAPCEAAGRTLPTTFSHRGEDTIMLACVAQGTHACKVSAGPGSLTRAMLDLIAQVTVAWCGAQLAAEDLTAEAWRCSPRTRQQHLDWLAWSSMHHGLPPTTSGSQCLPSSQAAALLLLAVLALCTSRTAVSGSRPAPHTFPHAMRPSAREGARPRRPPEAQRAGGSANPCRGVRPAGRRFRGGLGAMAQVREALEDAGLGGRFRSGAGDGPMSLVRRLSRRRAHRASTVAAVRSTLARGVDCWAAVAAPQGSTHQAARRAWWVIVTF